MKKRTKEYGLLGATGLSLIYAVITYAVSAAVLSPVAYMLASPSKHLGIFSMLSLFLSGSITGISAARKKGEVRVIVALLSSLAVTVLLLGTSLIARRTVGGAVIINCVIFALSALVFSFLYHGKRTRRARRIRRA